ncbi:hypothetical protein EV424DRAFT_119012 [Suillus variegatus]|nr:hypothetical protein EV424DRAFT_119012 [Suillus variegatus]
MCLHFIFTGTSHRLQNTSSPKAFLSDISSKIHVATDACRLSPTLAPTPPPIATTSTPPSGPTPAATPPLTSSTSPVPGTTLMYHLVMPHLALLALLPTTAYDMRRGLVEWNVVWFRVVLGRYGNLGCTELVLARVLPLKVTFTTTYSRF